MWVSVSYLLQQEKAQNWDIHHWHAVVATISLICSDSINIFNGSKLRQHILGQMQTEIQYRKLKHCSEVFHVSQNMRNKRKQSLAATHLPILVSSLNCKTMLAILCLFFGVSWESEMRSREKGFQQDVLHRVNPSWGLSENWIRAHIYGLALLKYF